MWGDERLRIRDDFILLEGTFFDQDIMSVIVDALYRNLGSRLSVLRRCIIATISQMGTGVINQW